jgi:hypothetical protein
MARFYAQAVGPKKNEIFALLDVSRASANFMVVGMGAPLMSRAIPVGTAAMSADVSSRDRLVTEVKASIEAFTQETSLNVSRVILTQALEGVDVMITGAMGLLVEIFPYARRIKAAKAVQETLAKDFSDDSALDIIAAGCTAVACGADLVPQEIRDQRAVAEKGRETLKAAVLVLLLLLAIGGGLLSRVYFKDVFLRQNLREKYADQKKEVGVLESMITKTAIVRDYLKVRSLPLEAIRELYTIIPEEIYLSSVSIDDGGAVSIQGVSASMSRVFSVVTALEDSPLFENVKTKSTTAKKEAGKDVAAFEIVLKLSSVNEERAAADVKPGPQGASLDQ